MKCIRSSSETTHPPAPVLFDPPPRPTYRRPRGNSFRCAFACVTTPLRAYSRIGYNRATYRCTFAHAIGNCPVTRRHPVRMNPASATTPQISSYSVFATSSVLRVPEQHDVPVRVRGVGATGSEIGNVDVNGTARCEHRPMDSSAWINRRGSHRRVTRRTIYGTNKCPFVPNRNRRCGSIDSAGCLDDSGYRRPLCAGHTRTSAHRRGSICLPHNQTTFERRHNCVMDY